MKLRVVLVLIGLMAMLITTAMISAQQVSHQPGFVENPRHATQMALAPERNLLGDEMTVTATGEQTLYDAARAHDPLLPSLGSVARQNRAEHAAVPKAKVVWTDQ